MTSSPIVRDLIERRARQLAEERPWASPEDNRRVAEDLLRGEFAPKPRPKAPAREVTMADNNGYPAPEVVAEVLAIARQDLLRSTGTAFKLELDIDAQVLKATRLADGYHCAVAVPGHDGSRVYRRAPEEGPGSYETLPMEQRLRMILSFQLDDAVEAIENGHRAQVAASQVGAA